MTVFFAFLTLIDLEVLEKVEKLIGILFSVFSILGILLSLFMALFYVSKLEEKRQESLFGFYEKLTTYLEELKSILGESREYNLLLSYYTDESITRIEGFRKPKDEEISSFLDFLHDFVNFLKTTDNQVPLGSAYYAENFKQFRSQLFSLKKLGKIKKYANYDNNDPAKNEYDSIISLVDVLLKEIKSEQLKLMKCCFAKMVDFFFHYGKNKKN